MATTALGLALQISASTAGLAKSVNDVNAKLDSMAEAGKKSAKDLAILKTIEISRALIDGVTALANVLSSAASAAKGLFDDSRNAIDAIGKLADQTGVSEEAMEEKLYHQFLVDLRKLDYQDKQKFKLDSLKIDAQKAIGVAYGKNQPTKVPYNTRGW